MNTLMNITICPSCGSPNIHRQEGEVTGTYHGQSYVIPSVSFYACADCGEKVYDREAMRTIERSSPVFQQRVSSRRSGTPKKLRISAKKKIRQTVVVP